MSAHVSYTKRLRAVGSVVVALAIISSGLSLRSATSARASSQASGPTYGGTFYSAFHDDWSSMDPAIGYDAASWVGERSVMNGLLTYPQKTGAAGGTLLPDLAISIPKPSNGGKTYVFHLRHGVLFQAPYSREVTAADFKYSLERMLDPKPTDHQPGPMVQSSFWSGVVGIQPYWAGKAKHVSGIKALDRYTLEFDLTAPNVSFLNILAMPFAFVVPHEAVAAAGKDFSHHVVGAGPFILKRWLPGREIDFVRNPHYYIKGVPYIDGAVMRIGVTEELQLLQFERGQIDMPGDGIASSGFLSIVNNPKYKPDVAYTPDVAVNYLAMNTQMAPFKGNVNLRRALNYAINKARIIQLLNGRGVAMASILPPTMPGFDPTFKGYPYDPAMARKLLAAAGYKPGQLTITCLTIESLDNEKILSSVQQDLAAIGINMKIRTEASSTFYSEIGKPHTATFVFNGWSEDFPDPSDFIDPILSCSSASVSQSSSNAAWYCNPTVDALAARARGNPDSASRFQQYHQVVRMIMADAPWVPIYDDILYFVHSSRLHNYFVNPTFQPIWMDHYWLQGGKATNPAGQ